MISLGGHGATPVGDTYLRLRDSAGNLIDQDDDSGDGLNSQLVFTASTSGTYYLDAGAYNDGYTGDYQLSVVVPEPLEAATYDEIADQLVNGY